MTYILVDTANTFFRARHVIRGDADIKVGMAFHITFNSIKKAWNDLKANMWCSASKVVRGVKIITSPIRPIEQKLVRQ